MKRALALLLSIFLASPALSATGGVGGVYTTPKGGFTSLSDPGTNPGILAADARMTSTGHVWLGGGTEGLAMPPYRHGCIYFQHWYTGFGIWGVPTRFLPDGVERARVDSTGVVVDQGAVLTLQGSLGNLTSRTTGDFLDFSYTGAVGINGATPTTVVRLLQNGTNRVEANTAGVNLIGNIRSFGKHLVDDSLRVGNKTDLNGNVTIGNASYLGFYDAANASRKVLQPSSVTTRVFPVGSGGAIALRDFANTQDNVTVSDVGVATMKTALADSIRGLLRFTLPSYTVAAVPAFANASVVYLTDALPTNPCTAGGTGKLARRENGVWNCGPSDPSLTTDSLGTIVQAGRLDGQVALGSTRTSTAATAYLGFRGYNDATASGAAWFRLDQDVNLRGDNVNMLERGTSNTKGWIANLGVDLANVTHDGQYRLNPITSGLVVNLSGAGGTVPGIEIVQKAGATASLQKWENSGGTQVAYIDSIFGVKATRVIAYDSLRVVGKSDLGGIQQNGWGFKHARVTTGSIGAASTALVTVTWTTAFSDANYTVSANVEDTTTSSLSLSVVHVETKSASAVTVRVLNNAAGALTGTLHVIGVHD